MTANDRQPDHHDTIRVRGARAHNLKNVSVDLPKRKLTVATGVSGSGKSSLIFATIAAESRRLINETYSAFAQTYLPAYRRPEVDSLENLTAAIVIDQEPLAANARSTVGTATDVYSLLRLVFSRLSTPHVGSSSHFSFNLPEGMCPACEGLGRLASIDETQLVDRSRTLNEGAITVPNFGPGTWYWRYYAESERLDPDKRLADYTPEEWAWLMYQEPTKTRLGGMNTTYEGLVPKVRRVFFKDTESRQRHIRAFVERASTVSPCPDCGGTRLAEAPRTATVNGSTIGECARWEITELLPWVESLADPAIAPARASLAGMLTAMVDLGLGYLSLDRESGTLSGGEAQRVKMVRHLGSPLTDVTYVFDEPTAGLHPHDVARMSDLMLQLRDKGNTILVIEHNPQVIAIADHVVDLGPGAGDAGGRIVYSGPPSGLSASESVTGRLLDRPPRLRDTVRTPTGHLAIRHATTNNLKDVSVDIPTGVLVAVTGVAGSGKSSLIHGSLSAREGVVLVDQSPIRGSRRSNPATFTGLLDTIRAAFAKANGVKASLFSSNSDGACPACGGHGVIYTDLAVMAGVTTTCEECGGRRFKPEVLTHRLHGLTIDEVLNLEVSDALAVFHTGKAAATLRRLLDVGLPYLRLGQPLTSLSGGERQRLKLAASLTSDAHTYVLDEPSSGLHLADTDTLNAMLNRIVDTGRSVVVIEHNLAVIAQADWIIDIGPGAGHEGGQVIFTGTPAEMLDNGDSPTAVHLRKAVGG
ncbi:ATP-binding cassette domain-containing protein [Goodfellowiella coeruleoviolacea]|uniref:UvrABC system protein A n=1 Tax=Goodfellowiella coeruleoviolacea TaxID=334858 RepID=A0AAE3GG76_9PSEU|nr:excinuclease ABC subunit UvrA [Goodfellowiella coeruleoviolacea]MCP2167666.1 Excinuclease UvrABC ATPase subunit [Goodfellowiella coeruleoviolacea]